MNIRVFRCCAGLIAGLVLFTANSAGAAPDPFYSSLQEEGRLALEARDFAAAERTLKVAAFGLLEEPQSLASCLTLLALAQDGGKRAEPFRATVLRIAELERRFGAYRAGGLDPETRKRFEEAVRRNLTSSALAALPWIEHVPAPAAVEGASKKSRRSRPAESGTVKVAAAETPRAQDAKATPKAGDVARSAPVVTTQKPPLQATPPAAPEKTPPAPEKTQPAPAEATHKAPVQATAPRQEPAKVSVPAPKPVPPPAPPRAPAAAPARAAASPQASEPPAPALEVAKLRQTMAATTTLSAMRDVLRQAQALARAYPASAAARRLVAESAYRSSQWATAAEQYAQIVFDPETEPLLCYYAAVSFFEVGNTSGAAKLLRQCEDLLAPTPAVQSYVERILGGEAASPRP